MFSYFTMSRYLGSGSLILNTYNELCNNTVVLSLELYCCLFLFVNWNENLLFQECQKLLIIYWKWQDSQKKNQVLRNTEILPRSERTSWELQESSLCLQCLQCWGCCRQLRVAPSWLQHSSSSCSWGECEQAPSTNLRGGCSDMQVNGLTIFALPDSSTNVLENHWSLPTALSDRHQCKPGTSPHPVAVTGQHLSPVMGIALFMEADLPPSVWQNYSGKLHPCLSVSSGTVCCCDHCQKKGWCVD